MISNSIHLSELKVGVIINASSGGYDLECEHKMLDILKGAGIVEVKIWCGDTDQMERSFTEATRRKLEVLVVLGGDGTIRTAAERCGAERSYRGTLAIDNDRLTATPVYPRRRDSRFRECALCDREARLGGRFVRSNFIFLHASIRKPACSVCRSTLPVVPGRVVIKDVKSKTASRLVNWE
jgi:Diacylglycerol kinase catalytic domain